MIEPVFNILKQDEKITIFTPLGIRFWDPVQKVQITDNLTVRAIPEDTRYPIVNAFRTASGIYAFQGLPGLHGIEYPENKRKPNLTKSFIIDIKDNLNRFLPVIFSVSLPLSYKGIYLTYSQNSLPLDDLPGFFLFSAPTRSISSGIAAVRGQLIVKSTNLPAAHAVLEVQVDGKKWYGIADDRGCIAVMFPYPAFLSKLMASPSNERLPLSLNQQHWNLTIRVRYAQDVLKYPQGINIPYLSSILNQPLGLIWSTIERYAPEMSLNLIFDQENILHTGGLSESIMWIDTGTSPI